MGARERERERLTYKKLTTKCLKKFFMGLISQSEYSPSLKLCYPSKDGRTSVKVRRQCVNADNYRYPHIRKSTNPTFYHDS